MKAVVIGLDSASWNLLMPWIKEGALPTFSRLINEGVHGYLRSCDPPITFPAWKCYSTGKNPGKLGVYSFVGFDKKKKDIIFHTGFDFKEKEIWDYLNEKGLKTCVINMPGTYPPKKVGVMISGGPVLGNNYVSPKEIKKHLEQIEYRIDPEIYPGKENSAREHDHLKKLISSRFNAAKIIKNNYNIDFFHITIFYIDKIQHSYFNNKSILMDYWRLIDKEIEKLLKEFDDKVNLVLMSDHGATELKNTLYLNEFLLKSGYLTLKSQNNHTTQITSKTIEFVFRKLKKNPVIVSEFKKLIPKTLKNYTTKILNENRKSKFLDKIDWDRSDFIDIGMGFGLIYMLNEYSDPEKLKKELEEITDPITGKKVCLVFLKNQIYKGNLNDAPDIIVTPSSNTMITEVIRANTGIWGDTPNDWKGLHEREGIFLAHGPDIRTGNKIENATIYDLAPTILYMFGLPIPNDMDGRILKEIFIENSELDKRNVTFRETSYDNKEADKIKRKVEKLRYNNKI